MSGELKIENNAAVNNQTIIHIQNMSGNIAIPENPTYVVAENVDAATKTNSTTTALNNELYNLFVVGCETFESGRFTLPNGRVLNGNLEIEERYASFSADALKEIKGMPSLFMSENRKYGGSTEPDHTAYFGVVTDVRKQRKQTIVAFKTIMEIPQQAIIDLAVYLGIDNEGPGLTELNVTRWSIKRADLLGELRLAGFSINSSPRGLLSSREKIVSIPLEKNFNFEGRSEYLRDILKRFNESTNNTPSKQTICGLGGIGKTQLALQYAYENIHNYDAVCWVECSSEASVKRSCENFLAQARELLQANTEAVFAQWFQSHSNWLLIFDDVVANVPIESLIPKIGEGHVLVTTQQSKSEVILLNVMEIEEAVDFILRRTGINDTPAANSIAKRLGRFPLALEQATAYVREIKIDLSEYLELINKHGLDIFDEQDEVECYNRNIRTVWNITLDKLNETERQLLYCFAYMSSDIIALDWLVEHAKKLCVENEMPETNDSNVNTILKQFMVSSFSSDLIATLTDDAKRYNAVRKLARYSLITIKQDKTITMHGLLQEVIRKTITDPVYLLSVWEVLKSKRSDVGLIYNDYHIALPFEQAKAMILTAETLLNYGKEYEAANDKPNVELWELEFDFYSLFAQYLTLRGIRENNAEILQEADRCYVTACEIGTPLYGGGEDSELLSGASTFTVIQEKHRRMRVNLLLKRVDEARKIYAEVRAPVSKSLKQEPNMSYHAFNNFGDLWHEFGFLPEAVECYELALKVGLDDKKSTLLEKIANCKNGGSCNV